MLVVTTGLSNAIIKPNSTLCLSVALCTNSALQLIRIEESKKLTEEKASLLRELKFLIDIEQKERYVFPPNPPSGAFMTYGTLFKDPEQKEKVLAMAEKLFLRLTIQSNTDAVESYYNACLKTAAKFYQSKEETEIKFFNSQI